MDTKTAFTNSFSFSRALLSFQFWQHAAPSSAITELGADLVNLQIRGKSFNDFPKIYYLISFCSSLGGVEAETFKARPVIQ